MADNRIVHLRVFTRIDPVDAAAQHSDRAAWAFDRALVGVDVDPLRQAADDADAFCRKVFRQCVGNIFPVRRRTTAANHADVQRSWLKLSFDIEQARWLVHFL